MSAWAWKDCPDCGNHIHINTKCECGGNPWGYEDEKKFVLTCDQILKALNIKITHKDEYKKGSAFADILTRAIGRESEEFIQGVIDSFTEGF